MWKVPAAACVVLSLLAAPANALELKSLRAVYGPFGPARADSKFLPGDVLHVSFDILGVKVDAKTGMAKYNIAMELLDSKGAMNFTRNKNNDVPLGLGGSQLPGFAEVLIGTDQAPGKYTLKVRVKDLVSKETKEISYPFEIEPESFGFVRLFAPEAGFTGQTYQANFAVIGMGRDAKKKPNVSLRTRVLDEAGKEAHAQPMTIEIPKDLHEDLIPKIDMLPFIPLEFPLFLNRPGRFTIEVEGTDNISKKTAKLRFPLVVLDPGTIGGK
jgi:hypothetical protein